MQDPDLVDDRAERQREQRRREIVDAAKQVFAERGYHKASINDIIERAAIARGTFYLYFSSKQSVFETILGEAVAELRGRILRVEVGEGARPPGEQLHDNVTRVLGFVLRDRALMTLVLNHGQAPDSQVAERVEAFHGEVRSMIRDSLEYGISAGLARPCDVEVVSAAILGAVRGVCAQLIARDREPDVDRVARELIDFALHGVVLPGRW